MSVPDARRGRVGERLATPNNYRCDFDGRLGLMV
jgi:hypothetical protein